MLDFTEILLIGVLALILLGPEDFISLMQSFGKLMRKINEIKKTLQAYFEMPDLEKHHLNFSDSDDVVKHIHKNK